MHSPPVFTLESAAGRLRYLYHCGDPSESSADQGATSSVSLFVVSKCVIHRRQSLQRFPRGVAATSPLRSSLRQQRPLGGATRIACHPWHVAATRYVSSTVRHEEFVESRPADLHLLPGGWQIYLLPGSGSR